ncbi:MAG TPA: hypothetical protein VMT64_03000 [Candidatus Binataceae bacterium]|nr:hypothetical protein [Candidatus Binataceae bacterium]
MMSISAVSSLASLSAATATDTTRNTGFYSGFEQLASSLQSGNLSGAQQAYNTLSGLLKNSTTASPVSQAFKAIGEALQSGNLGAAQQAFSTLQQDIVQGLQSLFSGRHHGGATSQLVSATNPDDTSDNIFAVPTSGSGNSNNTDSAGSQAGVPAGILNVLA